MRKGAGEKKRGSDDAGVANLCCPLARGGGVAASPPMRENLKWVCGGMETHENNKARNAKYSLEMQEVYPYIRQGCGIPSVTDLPYRWIEVALCDDAEALLPFLKKGYRIKNRTTQEVIYKG